ncbi:hypothetical protein HK405_011880, partial [Cladochytrium tenue]
MSCTLHPSPSRRQRHPPSPPQSPPAYTLRHRPRAIAALPLEILAAIVALLPRPARRELRRACRALAAAADPQLWAAPLLLPPLESLPPAAPWGPPAASVGCMNAGAPDLQRLPAMLGSPSVAADVCSYTDEERCVQQRRLCNGDLVRHLRFPDGSVAAPVTTKSIPRDYGGAAIAAVRTEAGGRCLVNLAAVAALVPGLVSLDLSGVDGVCDASMEAFFGGCPSLRELAISDCLDVTDGTLLALAASRCAPSLERLELDRCSLITDHGICAALKHLPRLRRLSLCSVPFATEATLLAAARHCRLLEHVGAGDTTAACDVALPALAAGCRRLRSFDFSECPRVSAPALALFCKEIAKNSDTEAARVAPRGLPEKIAPTPVGSSSLPLSVHMEDAGAMCGQWLAAVFPAASERMGSACTGGGGDSCRRDAPVFRALGLAWSAEVPMHILGPLSAASGHELTTLDIGFTELLWSPSDSTEGEGPGAALAACIRLLPRLRVLRIARLVCRPSVVAEDGAPEASLVDDVVCEAVAAGPGPALVVLDISDNEAVTDAGMAAIVENCPGLVDLNVRGCTRLSDASLALLGGCGAGTESSAAGAAHEGGELRHRWRRRRRPRLASLNFGMCARLTDVAVEAVARLCVGTVAEVAPEYEQAGICSGDGRLAGLQTLKLSGCVNITDRALAAVAASVAESASVDSATKDASDETDCDGCWDDTGGIGRNTASSKRVGRLYASLQTVCLSGCRLVTSCGVRRLVSALPQLASINLYACGLAADDATVTALARGCTGLRALVVSRCAVTDIGALALAGAGLARLHTLHMAALLPASAMVPEVGGGGDAVPEGTRWRRKQQQLTDAGLRALLTCCPGLRLLDVSFNPGITDGGLVLPPCSNLPLREAGLRACAGVTAAGARALAVACPRLARLELGGCARVTAGEASAIEAELAAREVSGGA